MIQITKPETEALIERHLLSGRFHDVDELIERALGSLDAQDPAPDATMPHETLHEFFMKSPLRGANLNLERVEDYPRPVDFR